MAAALFRNLLVDPNERPCTVDSETDRAVTPDPVAHPRRGEGPRSHLRTGGPCLPPPLAVPAARRHRRVRHFGGARAAHYRVGAVPLRRTRRAIPSSRRHHRAPDSGWRDPETIDVAPQRSLVVLKVWRQVMRLPL